MLTVMESTTLELESRLGESVTMLQLRIGFHSGPVTAGVLRGEKCRFQLFGDTVNTASRMESTGCPGKIQLSSSSESLLRSTDMSSLLSVREGGVEAKGKGRLQTFWLAGELRSLDISI